MQLTSLSLALTRAGFLSVFSPVRLFALGEQGAWFDPADLGTLWQDDAGTTPVTAVEQPVGKMLDKSGRNNHAFQTTSTKRPVLSARVNLLTKTEQFDAAVWVKTGVGTLNTNTDTGADGTQTADVATANAALFRFYQQFTLLAGEYEFSIYLRRQSGSAQYAISIDGLTFTNVTVTSTLTRFSITTTVSAGTVYPQIRAQNATVADTLTIWGADLRPANAGANLPAYQRVNTSTDYDSDPAKWPYYLRTDGIDDFMVTNTITPGTDKVQVFAGVRKLSDATQYQIIIESSHSYSNNNGAFILSSSWNAGQYATGSSGTSFTNCTTSPLSAPRTDVATMVSSIADDTLLLRINGSQAASSTADQGTGNYLAYPLYLFMRAGTQYPFNGHFYGMIVRFGANLDTATIEQTEDYLAAKTGITF